MIGPFLRSVGVIARRDCVAVIFSRAFVFFLLGPLFPVVVGLFAGSVGSSVEQSLDDGVIGVAMPGHEGDRLAMARDALVDSLAGPVPVIVVLKRLAPGEHFDARAALRDHHIEGVVTGTLSAPVLTATTGRGHVWYGPLGLIATRALTGQPAHVTAVGLDIVATSAARERNGRTMTAQGAQLLLFMLTMLLAGMVLSNLVEEKTNKIIEVLAAAIPLDALFLGKLVAMLVVSLVGISVWGLGFGVMVLAGMRSIPMLATPAVGWPLFAGLGLAYFAMAYLLLGAVFLAIGGLATTVREVQTLSMPATMLQLLVFLVTGLALAHQGGALDWAARLVPVSSPYAMIARAALDPAIAPHVLALAWQAAWVVVFVRAGSGLFRRTVLKSGPARSTRPRWFARWRRQTY